MSGSSRQLTHKKGAPEDQVGDLLCMHDAASQLPGRGPTDLDDAPAPAC